MKKVILCVLLLGALAAGIVGGLAQIRPVARPQGGSEAFDRVLADVGSISAVPHPSGSPENMAVRDYILNRVNSLGLTAEVLPFEMDVKAFVAGHQERYDTGTEEYREWLDQSIRDGGCASLEEYIRGSLRAEEQDILFLNNLLVKVAGTAPQGAAMFVSHYDSVSSAPGAADDGLAVACMLDLMKTMAQTPPANDVYFLYTDGEEIGLLGAADFVRTQPAYANEVDVLFNFEARGSAGALLMFETSPGDYELVRQYRGSVPQPVTFSIATAIYEQMPNGTDFSEFKKAGYKGLNFAMIEGDENYHQPSDNLENLNRDTAWQYHQTVAALGGHFGKTNLKAVGNNQNALYFPLPLAGVVVLPALLGWVLGFAPLALALFLVFLTLRHNKKGMSPARRERVLGLLLLGALPAVVTGLFFAASYMLSIPALLFLLADLCLGMRRGARAWPGAVVLLLAVLMSALLFAPITYLVHLALKLWLVTAVFALAPLLPTVIYGIKIARRV